MIKFKTITKKSKRLALSGKGGCGKSYAITNLYKSPLIFDLEQKWTTEAPFNKFQVVDFGDKPSYNIIMQSLIGILNEADLKKYDALVIDTVSEVETLCVNHSIIEDYKGKKSNYSSYSSGDNHELPQYFSEFLRVLQDIQAKHDIDVCLICHARKTMEQNVMGDDYSKVVLDLKKHPMAKMLKWVDYLGCIYDDVDVENDGLKMKIKDSKRMISFDNSSPYFDAKSARSGDLLTVPFDIKGEWVNKIFKKPEVKNG